jgi:flagellar protein FliS
MALADSYPRPTSRSGAASAPASTGSPQAAVSNSLPPRMGNRPQNTANQYQRAQIETASPTRLVILLYEGAIRFCQLALDAMSKGDLAVQHSSLLRAQRIVAELLSSLNREKGGDVAENLARLYTHMLEQLVLANLHDHTKPVHAVQSMLRDLRASWIEVEQLTNGEGKGKEENASASRLSQPAALKSPSVRLGERNA